MLVLAQLLELLTKNFSCNHRDIGEHIRYQVTQSFPQGESSKVNVEHWSKFVEHLENIASDKSLKKHPRKLKSSATGLSLEECREIVSTNFLAYLQGKEDAKTSSSKEN